MRSQRGPAQCAVKAGPIIAMILSNLRGVGIFRPKKPYTYQDRKWRLASDVHPLMIISLSDENGSFPCEGSGELFSASTVPSATIRAASGGIQG